MSAGLTLEKLMAVKEKLESQPTPKMFKLLCPHCGEVIDIFSEEEINEE